MNLNFSEVKTGRDPLPEGIYILEVLEAEEKTSATGKPMIAVKFKEQETGNFVFANFVLLAENLWFLKSFLEAMGVEVGDDMDSTDIVDKIIGAEVKAKLTQREYNGQVSNNVKNFLPV